MNMAIPAKAFPPCESVFVFSYVLKNLGSMFNLCSVYGDSLISRYVFVTSISVLIASVLILFVAKKEEHKPLRTTYYCTSPGSKALCNLNFVCYDVVYSQSPLLEGDSKESGVIKQRNRVQSHQLHGFNMSPLPTDNPLALLIATDEFPQSGIYLYASPDNVNEDQFEETDTILLTRFKPDNLMHVLHDDVFPLYATLANVYGTNSTPYSIKIMFSDEYGEMPYDSLYGGLSTEKLEFFTVQSQKRCFKKLIVGFDRSTLWYQYGFNKPQGPVPHNKELINAIITSFTKSTQLSNYQRPKKIVLFSRSETRLILNEDELSKAISLAFSLSVKIVGLETHSLDEIIEELSDSSIILGMHGALLASMIWMPPQSIVLELFPYAVNPAKYTPYKTLAEIMGFTYLAWRNYYKSHTVGHTDYPKEFGGLQHLNDTEIEEVLATIEVKPHFCCEDPSWLYHINQDTIVNTQEIISLLSEHVIKAPFYSITP